MDILFIGGIFHDETIHKKSKKRVQNAANALQWNIIKGLDKNIEKPIKILNSIFVGSYPRHYDDLIIRSHRWSHVEKANDKNVGFINLPGIKHFSRAKNIAKQIKYWAQAGKGKKYIICYSVHTPFLYAIKQAKKINPNIEVCLIVPDLPQYMNLSDNPSRIYTYLKSIDYQLIQSMLKYIDSYVLLTDYMADKIGIPNDKYIVIEGMVNVEGELTDGKTRENLSNLKTILYTGSLNSKYGIKTLLEAFKLIKDENFKLQICGTGEAGVEIKKLSKIDSRIEFLGNVTREKALHLQRNATVLINPRNSEGEFTKYSFPSKNLEYLLSGRPTIAYNLPGIPSEYEEYMYFIKEPTPKSMVNKILEVCNKDYRELDAFGERAQKFVLKEKNNVKQSKRIIELLNR